MTMTANQIGTNQQGAFARACVLAYGVLVYLLFFATFSYIPHFLANIGPGPTVDRGAVAVSAASIAINVGLLLLFGVQHSIMARSSFKRRLLDIMPASLERSTFVLASTLVFVMLFVFWRPIGTTVWHVEAAWARHLITGVMMLGFMLVLYTSFLINHFDLFGLRQTWLAFRNKPYTDVPFVKPAVYRIVRHPMQVGMLMLFWAAPTMTLGHLLLAAGMTLYILIGLWFEERDLLRTYGETYATYKRQVPQLLPFSTRRGK